MKKSILLELLKWNSEGREIYIKEIRKSILSVLQMWQWWIKLFYLIHWGKTLKIIKLYNLPKRINQTHVKAQDTDETLSVFHDEESLVP